MKRMIAFAFSFVCLCLLVGSSSAPSRNKKPGTDNSVDLEKLREK